MTFLDRVEASSRKVATESYAQYHSSQKMSCRANSMRILLKQIVWLEGCRHLSVQSAKAFYLANKI